MKTGSVIYGSLGEILGDARPPGKPILVLDFDGVIHSYKSGWKGARVIPDPPVPGSLQFLAEALNHFDVQVFSSRSGQFGGIRAMKKWLWREYALLAGVGRRKGFPWALIFLNKDPDELPSWYREAVLPETHMGQWIDEVNEGVCRLIKKIKFPRKKPPAFLIIDDRAICFNGYFDQP